MLDRPVNIRSTAVVLLATIVIGLGACNSTEDIATASAHGLASQIVAMAPDSTGGYIVSLKVTTSTPVPSRDSGCPFIVQVWQQRQWADPYSGSRLPIDARTIEPGMSLTFTTCNTLISTGDVVETVTPWLYFNGTIVSLDSAISATFSVR